MTENSEVGKKWGQTTTLSGRVNRVGRSRRAPAFRRINTNDAAKTTCAAVSSTPEMLRAQRNARVKLVLAANEIEGSFKAKPWIRPATLSTANISKMPTALSQKCQRMREADGHSQPTSRG